jgi:tetratricopeptide (TPR) repeat protein
MLATAAVFVVATALYLPTLGHGFVWDDLSILMANDSLSDWSKLGANLAPGFFHEQASEQLRDYWRPAVVLSHMVDRTLFSEAAWGPHLVNMLLHAMTSVLVLLLCHAWFRSVSQALVAGLVFAAHPVHVEAAAWVSGRSDLLLGLFFALALWADFQHGRTGRARWLALSLSAFALALLSKEAAVVFPVLIVARVLLSPSAPAPDGPKGENAFIPVVASLAVLALFLWVRFGFLGAAAPDGVAPSVDRVGLFWTWWSAFWLYLKLLAFPVNLTILHQVDLVQSLWSPNVIAGLLVFLGLAWTGWKTRRQASGPAFGIAVLLVSLGVVSNFLIPVSRQGGAEFPVAERFLYVPSIGFSLMAAWFLGGWIPSRLRRASTRSTNGGPKVIAGALGGLLILALAVRSEVRIRDWKSDLSLFGQAVAASPGSYLAHLNYAAALVASTEEAADLEGRRATLDVALAHYLEAAEIAPDNHRIHYDLANLYRSTGLAAEALESYRRALQLNPDMYQARINLGTVLALRGDLENALQQFEAAESLRPDHPVPKVNRAHVLQMLGRPERSIPLYEEALALDPGLTAARDGLARARQAVSTGEPNQGS